MTDIKTLALKYGGYTSLDKVYLDQLLAGKTDQEQLTLITPPPSVVNAYFAELYQKKSPQAATDYFAELSQELNLYNTEPSFTLENKPLFGLICLVNPLVFVMRVTALVGFSLKMRRKSRMTCSLKLRKFSPSISL